MMEQGEKAMKVQVYTLYFCFYFDTDQHFFVLLTYLWYYSVCDCTFVFLYSLYCYIDALVMILIGTIF